MYQDASDAVRRQLNSELFDTFIIDDEDVIATKSEIYEALTAPDLITALSDELDELKGENGDDESQGDENGHDGGSSGNTGGTDGAEELKRTRKERTARPTEARAVRGCGNWWR